MRGPMDLPLVDFEHAADGVQISVAFPATCADPNLSMSMSVSTTPTSVSPSLSIPESPPPRSSMISASKARLISAHQKPTRIPTGSVSICPRLARDAIGLTIVDFCGVPGNMCGEKAAEPTAEAGSNFVDVGDVQSENLEGKIGGGGKRTAAVEAPVPTTLQTVQDYLRPSI